MDIQGIAKKLICHQPGVLGVTREYTVLVPLIQRGDEVYVLFEVRAETMRRQPGETCFPGGHREEDESILQCGIRETGEELGILPSDIRPLAQLDTVYHQAGFLLYPFVVEVNPEALNTMNPNPDEVKTTFEVPLSYFRDTPPQRYTYSLEPNVGPDFPYEAIGFPQGYLWRPGKVEVFIWNYQSYPIWGLTARILHNMLEKGQLL